MQPIATVSPGVASSPRDPAAAESAVADAAPPEKLRSYVALITGPALGSAFIIGAMTGGILTKKRGPRVAILVATIVAACNFVFTLLAFKEERPKLSEGKRYQIRSPTAGIVGLLRTKRSVVASAAYLLFFTALYAFQINFFNYASYRFGFDRIKATGVQAMSGIILATVQVADVARKPLRPPGRASDNEASFLRRCPFRPFWCLELARSERAELGYSSLHWATSCPGRPVTKQSSLPASC
eukprot:scaffold1130_cov195-Pinguiococcus_pyrenoidosus.AAC.47